MSFLFQSTLFLGQNTEVYFAPSVPMSTYLTCFIVSDFASKKEQINAAYGDDFELRIFATSHQLEKTNFALKTAVAFTEFYIENFKVEYPLPKLGKYVFEKCYFVKVACLNF